MRNLFLQEFQLLRFTSFAFVFYRFASQLLCLLPIFNGLFMFAIEIIDVATMFHHNRAFIDFVIHGLVNINAGFYILAFLEQNPSVCIQISTVGRFGLYRTKAHFFGFIQFFFLNRQIVGIIIQG